MDVTLEKLITSAEGVRHDLFMLISQAKGQRTCVQELLCPLIRIQSQTINYGLAFFVSKYNN